MSHASIEKILWGSKEVDGIMDISLDTDLFHDWITKVVCRAKNKDDLLRAVEAAKELGMEEYKDYFYTIKGYFCPNCGEKMKG